MAKGEREVEVPDWVVVVLSWILRGWKGERGGGNCGFGKVVCVSGGFGVHKGPRQCKGGTGGWRVSEISCE